LNRKKKQESKGEERKHGSWWNQPQLSEAARLMQDHVITQVEVLSK
jgi:hypothetical protein